MPFYFNPILSLASMKASWHKAEKEYHNEKPSLFVSDFEYVLSEIKNNHTRPDTTRLAFSLPFSFLENIHLIEKMEMCLAYYGYKKNQFLLTIDECCVLASEIIKERVKSLSFRGFIVGIDNFFFRQGQAYNIFDLPFVSHLHIPKDVTKDLLCCDVSSNYVKGLLRLSEMTSTNIILDGVGPFEAAKIINGRSNVYCQERNLRSKVTLSELIYKENKQV
ncbi:hypothetical protein BZG74_07055 [Salinivibrio sharmensis]|uniref:EAL domain-containing protein n=2 Tax=Salinivibrio sharmensis TaxID=390883 RepID=A0ABX3KHW4_9GAMM|nr:hypothetical protein BZG74_07055 [Salinivibrio sharmensis]